MRLESKLVLQPLMTSSDCKFFMHVLSHDESPRWCWEDFRKNPQVFTDGDGVAIPIIERVAIECKIWMEAGRFVALLTEWYIFHWSLNVYSRVIVFMRCWQSLAFSIGFSKALIWFSGHMKILMLKNLMKIWYNLIIWYNPITSKRALGSLSPSHRSRMKGLVTLQFFMRIFSGPRYTCSLIFVSGWN